MKSLKPTVFLLSVLGSIAGPLFAQSIKTYAIVGEADLSNLPRIPSDFQIQVCETQQPGRCGGSSVTWGRIRDNDRDGMVDNPRDGTMNSKGWMVADQFIKITNLRSNTPGWAVGIYTDNLNPNQTPQYTGINIQNNAAVSGLVSEDGKERIPLAWKLSNAPLSFSSEPFSEEVNTSEQCPNGFRRETEGFCDFSTHFMSDLNDRDPTSRPAGDLVWWTHIRCPADPSQANCEFRKQQARNYQSVYTSEGAGIGDIYRSPFPTYGEIEGALYIAAGFLANTVPAKYSSQIYLEFVGI